MAKQTGGSVVVKFLAWFTGIVVSLAVGMGLINGILTLPAWLGGLTNAGLWISMAVGWVVVLTTLVGAAMAILKR